MLRTITTTTITTTTAASGFVPSFLIKAVVAYVLLNSDPATTETTAAHRSSGLGIAGPGIDLPTISEGFYYYNGTDRYDDLSYSYSPQMRDIVEAWPGEEISRTYDSSVSTP